MKKIFLIIVIISFLSCEKRSTTELIPPLLEHDTLSNLSDSQQSSDKKNKNFKIGDIYSDADLNLAGIFLNYNSGRFKFEEEYQDFLIDSTITEEKKHQILLALNNENLNVENIIKITDFNVLNINDKGNLLMILFKKQEENKWKVVDILNFGKAVNEDEHQYKIEGNRYLSFNCQNNKHNQYFGIVINKINKSGKYEKVLKVFRFDLEKEKMIEVNLKIEKIECFAEIGDE